MKKNATRILTEAAMMIALAQILSYLKLFEFPNGGSIELGMLPIIFFACRHGLGWGTGAGFVYGVLQYALGNAISIDWTTLVADYLIAFTVLGLGAAVFYKKKYSFFYGAALGSLLRFISHFVVGAVVWGKYMPDEFFGMTMTNPWFYSLLYNGSYMLLDFLLVVVAGALLWKPLNKYFTRQDLLQQ